MHEKPIAIERIPGPWESQRGFLLSSGNWPIVLAIVIMTLFLGSTNEERKKPGNEDWLQTLGCHSPSDQDHCFIRI